MTPTDSRIFTFTDYTGAPRRVDPFATLEDLYYHCARQKENFADLWNKSAAQKEVTREDGFPLTQQVPATDPEGKVLTDAEGKPLLEEVKIREDDVVVQYEPRRILRQVASEVFKVKMWTEETPDGMTARELDLLLDNFFRFLNSAKKKPDA